MIGSSQRSGRPEAGELVVNYRKPSRRIAALIAFTIAVSILCPSAKAASPCREISFRGSSYVVFTLISTLTSFGSSGKIPSRSSNGGFDHLPRRIGDGPLVFAMNAGMYEEDLSPRGLYVEGGKPCGR